MAVRDCCCILAAIPIHFIVVEKLDELLEAKGGNRISIEQLGFDLSVAPYNRRVIRILVTVSRSVSTCDFHVQFAWLCLVI